MNTNSLSNLSALKLALLAREARATSQAALNADPIAIVGMACRTPGGGDTPDALWRLLKAGNDTTSEVPTDRWDGSSWFDPDPSAPGKSVTCRGAFLSQVDGFDADYFGILRREAEGMDPQQRLMLEVAIEAIDDAGIPHSTLMHARAAVFAASYHYDYARLVYDDIDAIDLRSLTGVAQSIIANRVSHFLDLRGPSVAIDSACSASLMAVHLACQSLRSGESDFALAGGVSLMLTPENMVVASKLGVMAPDGRCKAFDARADGIGRGEGCGVVALKRLSDALASGDRVHAIIRGSAVNQDGRSTVLAAPNGLAQEALVREALSNAAVGPERVVYVEAHGTGTALGDPIELGALSAALAAQNAPPCYVGSIKANIGHLEAAAGVIGLIKTALILREGEIPRQVEFETPNPHLDLADTRLRIADASALLPELSNPCAAVSSFGIGGTNAHVVLERTMDVPAPKPASDDAVWVLPLSAKSADGLRALGQAWLEKLADPTSSSVNDLCYTAARRRTHFPMRLAATGRTHSELRMSLDAALKTIELRAEVRQARLGFVYSGQGPQWWAMGRQLLLHEPAFATSLAKCDRAIRSSAGWSVLEELLRDAQSTRLSETEIAQPAIFAIQTALTELWQSWGIVPEAVVGHSVGEIAALHAAGALSLEEASRVVVLRGKAMQAVTGRGRMASAAVTESEARALTRMFDGRLDVAAINAPNAVVLSGERSALEEALALLAERGVKARALPVDYAFHSKQMIPLAERFERDLGELTWRTPDRAVFSALTGAALSKGSFAAADLASGIRSTVRFADAVKAMAASGIEAFVEIGPHPVLSSAIAQTLDAPPRVLAASLRQGRDERATMREACARLYAAGHDPDWRVVQPAEGVVATLPTYPWRRQRHWLRRNVRATTGVAKPQWLGAPMPLAGQDATAFNLNPAAIGDWLADHRIFGRSVTPGAVMMQAMTSAARIALGCDLSLKEFEIAAPLMSPEDPANTCWQIIVSDHVRPRVSLHEGVRPELLAPFSWRVVAEAKVGAPRDAAAWGPVAGEPLDIAAAYARVADLGATFGPTFRLLSDVIVGDQASTGWAQTPAGAMSVGVHPALIDAGLQLANFATNENDATYVPEAVEEVAIGTLDPQRVRVKARVTARTERSIIADVVVETEEGQVAASLTGVRLARATAEDFQKVGAAESYVIDWTPASQTVGPPRKWAVVRSSFASASEIAAVAAGRGAEAAEIATADEATDNMTIVVFADVVRDAAGLAAFINSITTNAQLTIVTRGAVATRAGEAADLAGAALWGLASVAALERPELGLRLLDLDPNATVRGKDVLAALEASSEVRLALRGGTVLAPRLSRLTQSRLGGAHRVAFAGEGLEAVTWTPFVASGPGFGEVRIRVAAAGVNFRDALMAVGMYPGTPVAPGVECAGTVEAVGPGVEGFEVGARVFGCAQASQATHALARADMISITPDALSDISAAALPSAYLTADIGLRKLANMQAGDRVLIHAATGGVGLAAVALAQRAGAEIYATAGSFAKRTLLEQMGIEHVYDSRSLDYADQILEATNGEGVRIALNSLTGAFVGATLRALAPGGILLELGKREIWSGEQVSAVRPDVKYLVYDTGRLLEDDPTLFGTFVRDLVPAICADELPVLPTKVWPMNRAAEAYACMAQARHTGKIVLTPPAEQPRIRKGATYLITGGLGGLGLLSADWLAQHGAQRLLLVGRTAPNAAAQAKIAALAARGVSVRVAIADAADIDGMRALVVEAAAEQAPIRGIIHAAGVAPDRTLARATPEDFAEARRGKVDGAHVLRAVTDSQELDFFLLYSSASLVFGAPGQGAYVASNSELEACATVWRREGVRASSVAWGPWAGAGMFAKSSSRAQSDIASRGLSPLSVSRAFAALESFLARDLTCGIIADVDWQRFLAHAPVGLELSMFASFARKEQALIAAAREQQPPPQVRTLRDVLAESPAGRRCEMLMDGLTQMSRSLLGIGAGVQLPKDAPLRDLGLDSLMAVELRNLLAKAGRAPLPATLLFDYPTLDALSGYLSRVWGFGEARAIENARPVAAEASAEIDALSDTEIEDLLRSELSLARGPQ